MAGWQRTSDRQTAVLRQLGTGLEARGWHARCAFYCVLSVLLLCFGHPRYFEGSQGLVMTQCNILRT